MWERERTKGREDQCKTHIVRQRVKTKHSGKDGRLQREAVFTPGSSRFDLQLELCQFLENRFMLTTNYNALQFWYAHFYRVE